LMIIPMLVKIDFTALSRVKEHWRGIGVTLFINWAVKPFSMALLGWIFIGWLFKSYLPSDQIFNNTQFSQLLSKLEPKRVRR